MSLTVPTEIATWHHVISLEMSRTRRAHDRVGWVYDFFW